MELLSTGQQQWEADSQSAARSALPRVREEATSEPGERTAAKAHSATRVSSGQSVSSLAEGAAPARAVVDKARPSASSATVTAAPGQDVVSTVRRSPSSATVPAQDVVTSARQLPFSATFTATPAQGIPTSARRSSSTLVAVSAATAQRVSGGQRAEDGAPAPPRTKDTGCDPACELRYLSLCSADFASVGTDPAQDDDAVQHVSCEANFPSLTSLSRPAVRGVCDASCEARLPSLFSESASEPQVCDASCEARRPSLLSAATSSPSLLPASTRDRACDASCEARGPSLFTVGTSALDLAGQVAFSGARDAESSGGDLPAATKSDKGAEDQPLSTAKGDELPEDHASPAASGDKGPEAQPPLADKSERGSEGQPPVAGKNDEGSEGPSPPADGGAKVPDDQPPTVEGSDVEPDAQCPPAGQSSSPPVPGELGVQIMADRPPSISSEDLAAATAAPSVGVDVAAKCDPACEVKRVSSSLPSQAEQADSQSARGQLSTIHLPTYETDQSSNATAQKFAVRVEVASTVTRTSSAVGVSRPVVSRASSSICLEDDDSDSDKGPAAPANKNTLQCASGTHRPPPRTSSAICVGSRDESLLQALRASVPPSQTQTPRVVPSAVPTIAEEADTTASMGNESRRTSTAAVGPGTHVDSCFSNTSSSDSDEDAHVVKAAALEGKRSAASGTDDPGNPAGAPAHRTHRHPRGHRRGPRSKSLDDLKAPWRRSKSRSTSRSPERSSDANPRPRTPPSPKRQSPAATNKQPSGVNKCSRIKDWLRGLAHGRWASTTRRLSVQTSTGDLTVEYADATPRHSRPASGTSTPRRPSPRPSRKDLFKTDRHAGCYPSQASPGTSRASSRAGSRTSIKSTSRTGSRASMRSASRTSSRTGRERSKAHRHSQHSVRFDLEASESDLGSAHSGLCHMATSTTSDVGDLGDSVGRARSLPQLPRRGGLKRGARDDAVKRSRCRSEARVTGDEVRLTASAVPDRHLQCYEERILLPPLPARSSGPTKAQRKPSATRGPGRSPAKRPKPRRTTKVATDTSTNSSDSLASSVASSVAEKAVIWTKPGVAKCSASGSGSNVAKANTAMWLMFPSLVARPDRPEPATALFENEPLDTQDGSASATLPVSVGAVKKTETAAVPKQKEDTLAAIKKADLAGAVKKTDATGAAKKTDTTGGIKKAEPTGAVKKAEKTGATRKMESLGAVKKDTLGAVRKTVTSSTGARSSSDSSSTSGSGTSGSLSPVPQVLSPPSAAAASTAALSSSRLFRRALRERVTIQEITSEDVEDVSPGTPTVGVTTSRLSCLQEETDSDVKLASVASGPSGTSMDAVLNEALDQSFNEADPVLLSRAQAQAWRVVEDTMAEQGGMLRRHHRRTRRGHDDDPRPRRRMVVDHGGNEDDLAPRPRRCVRARSPRSVPSSSARCEVTESHDATVDPLGSRTPKVRFSTASCSPPEALGHEDGELKKAVEARFVHLQQLQGPRRQSRSLTSMRACPTTDSPPPPPPAAPSPPRNPTRILVSRAKSTASVTGLHDRPVPTPQRTPSETRQLGRLLRPRAVMVVELFRKPSMRDQHSSHSSSS